MSGIEQLEDQLKNAKDLVKRRDKAIKLAKNTDFKDLILDGFIRDECSRLVGQSGDPALDEKAQNDCMQMAQSGGHLKRFLSVMIQMGNTAENEIHDIEAGLEELRAEGEDD